VAQAVCGGFESNDLNCCECGSYTVQRHSLCKEDGNSITSRRRQHSYDKYSVRKGQATRTGGQLGGLLTMKMARLLMPLLPTNVPADPMPLTRTPILEGMTLLHSGNKLYAGGLPTSMTPTRSCKLPRQRRQAPVSQSLCRRKQKLQEATPEDDIATLKCWQASHGGSGLLTTQKAALGIEAFLQLPAQPLFDRPAINVRHTSDVIPALMLQRTNDVTPTRIVRASKQLERVIWGRIG